MLTYLILPTNQRPIPTLKVTSKEFTREWEACWKDQSRDITYLTSIATPLIDHWEALLTKPEYPRDIGFISLCALLDNTNMDSALQIVSSWVHWAEQLTSVREELEILFIEHIRKARYYPRLARPVMAEYVIARDFKSRLVSKIKLHRHPDFEHDTHSPDTILCIVPEYPDYLMLKNLGLSNWESYLLKMMKERYSVLEISKLNRIPRETQYYEEKEIWDYLKNSFYNQEA
jgi:hypothetical protein